MRPKAYDIRQFTQRGTSVIGGPLQVFIKTQRDGV
jgi:hypothetical protein